MLSKIQRFEPLYIHFSGLLTAKFVLCQVKEGFTALQHEQKSSHVTVTPARSESALRDEDSCSMHNSIIQNQIEEIEKFLDLERLHSGRKRKYEEGQ